MVATTTSAGRKALFALCPMLVAAVSSGAGAPILGPAAMGVEVARAAGHSETEGWAAARFILTGHDGRIVSDEQLRGRHLLLTFGYTRCPDVCPTNLLLIAQAVDLLGSAAGQVQPVFITVDPERDSVAVLREYVPYFHARMLGLTGSPAMIARVAAAFRIKVEKVPLLRGGVEDYQIDHTAAILHIGPGGEIRNRFAPGTPVEVMARRVRESLGG